MIKVQFEKALRAPSGMMQLQINQQFERGKIYAVYGPSGSGKTTLLKVISGLMKPDAGLSTIDEERLPGFVFQDYALFPNMTVMENLLFASDDKAQADTLLTALEISGLKDRKPHQLSAGQQQRTAIARSLMQRPSVLLMDEAMAALDFELKTQTAALLKEYVADTGCTVVMVTHDLALIIQLADFAFELKKGKITREGEPAVLFAADTLPGLVLEIENGTAHVQIGTAVFKVNAKPTWKKSDTVYLSLS